MTCNTIVRQEIVGGPLSGLDAITALVSRRVVYMSDLSTFASDDNSATSITIELINASSVVVETIEWTTGNGNAAELGQTPFRHDDGMYSVRLTGRIKGVVMTRTIAGLLIDTTAPTITAANTLVPNANGDLTLAYEIEDDQFSDFKMQAVTADGETILEFRDPDPITGLARKVGVMTLLLAEGVPYSIYGVATDSTGNRKDSLLILATGPDKTKPVIGINTYEVVSDDAGKDGYSIRVQFGFTDNIAVTGATATLKATIGGAVLETVDVLNKTVVYFTNVSATVTYTVDITAVDAAGNVSTWSGNTVIPAKSAASITQVYNITHRHYTIEFKLVNSDRVGAAIKYGIAVYLDDGLGSGSLVYSTVLVNATYRTDPYYERPNNLATAGIQDLVPDTAYVVYVFGSETGYPAFETKAKFRTLPAPVITHSITPANLKADSVVVDYAFTNVVGTAVYKADLRKVSDNSLVVSRTLAGPTGAETFAGLTNTTDYKAVLTATSDLVPARFPMTSTLTFKTAAPVTNDVVLLWSINDTGNSIDMIGMRTNGMFVTAASGIVTETFGNPFTYGASGLMGEMAPTALTIGKPMWKLKVPKSTTKVELWMQQGSRTPGFKITREDTGQTVLTTVKGSGNIQAWVPYAFTLA